MSFHESANLNNSSSISMNQNRAEFLEKFAEQHNNSKLYEISQKGRWNQLYNHSKLRKMKEEDYRQKAVKEREQEMLTECTFHPKLTNNPNYFKNYLQTYHSEQPSTNQINNAYTPSINERHQAWLQRKSMKMEKIKQNETNKELKECLFKPEIVSTYMYIIVYRTHQVI
jgi:hypothetical protein